MLLVITLFTILSYFFTSLFIKKNNALDTSLSQNAKYRIAIASNPNKHKTSINAIAVNILKELSKEYAFEFIQIESSDSFDWVYAVGEIHEKNPLDLLIGVGWEASELFPIIHSRYDDLHYIILDNQVEFPYGKSVFFSRYDCSFLIGVMMATAFPEENVFGFISHFETLYTHNYIEGFSDGLKAINPKALVSPVFTKNYDNATIAYELTKEQNEFGIKVMMSTLSPQANEGVYKYAKESEQTQNPMYTTCLGVDETAENKPYILTGIIDNVELALRLVLSDFFYHGYNLKSMELGFYENATDVLFASTQDAHYRNEKIITDEVIRAGKKALEYIEARNARMRQNQTVTENQENEIVIRGTTPF